MSWSDEIFFWWENFSFFHTVFCEHKVETLHLLYCNTSFSIKSIASLVLWYKKNLISRNFSDKTVTAKLHNFRSTKHILWKVCHSFFANFLLINVLLKNFIYCKSIWRKKFSVAVNFSFFHTVKHSVEKENSTHLKDISWNHLIVRFVNESVNFTEFSPR